MLLMSVSTQWATVSPERISVCLATEDFRKNRFWQACEVQAGLRLSGKKTFSVTKPSGVGIWLRWY